MSGTGTARRTGERIAGVKQSGLVTEKQAARALGISVERLRLRIRLGAVPIEWVRGHRYVLIP